MNHITDNLLNKFIDDESEVSEINYLNEHIKVCGICKERLESLKHVNMQLCELKEYSPSIDFTAVLMKKLERSLKRKKEQVWFFSFVLSVFALIILGIIGYLVSITTFDFSASENMIKYAESLSKGYKDSFSWLTDIPIKRNLIFIESIFSLAVLISGWFFYDSQKRMRNILK